MVKRVVMSLTLIAVLVGCAGFFPYRHYTLDAENVSDIDRGILRGPKPKDDLPLAICKQTPDNKAPCIVVQSDVFYRIVRDFKRLENELVSCEQSLARCQ